MKSSLENLFLFIVIVLFLTACTNSDDMDSIEDPFDGLPVIDIGEPMDFNDNNLGGPEDFFFSSNYFHHVTFDRNGHFFVANRGDVTILHFDESGDFIGQIGARGDGPGEFQAWPGFDIQNQDTLFALDSRSWIVTRFVYEGGEWKYNHAFSLDRKDLVQPGDLIQIDSDQLAVVYTTNVALTTTEFITTVDLISVTGDVLIENWMSVPGNQYSIYRAQGGSGGVMHPLPFGPKSIFDSGPRNQFYHVWTGDFLIRTHDPYDVSYDSLNYNSVRLELNEERRRTAVTEHTGARMGSESEQQNMEEQLFDDIPLETPALQDMHVDRDTGHIIVRRYRFDDRPNWMLMDDEGERIGVFTLAENLVVHDFRNGKIIGTINNAEDLPTVRIVSLPQ